jgi:hypothetical protein
VEVRIDQFPSFLLGGCVVVVGELCEQGSSMNCLRGGTAIDDLG